MPCDGPSIEYAHKQAEKAYQEIELILKKYHISSDKDLEDYKVSAFGFDVKTKKQKFKDALKDLFWEEACDGW